MLPQHVYYMQLKLQGSQFGQFAKGVYLTDNKSFPVDLGVIATPYQRPFVRRFLWTLAGRRAPATGSTPHCKSLIVVDFLQLNPSQLLARPLS